MVESDLVFEGKVKHSGLFDFKELYRFIYNWFTDYAYFVEEKSYGEKVTPEGKNIDISWSCGRKISDYFRFTIKVDFTIRGMTTAELQKGNVKIKMDKGSVEIKFQGFLDKDYENRWENMPVAKFLRGVYDKYIIKTRVEHYEDKIAGEVDEVIAQVKSFLALEGRK